jgi:hypothetical protein
MVKLLESIDVVFQDVSLGTEYTLLEEDFFDTFYNHFDQIGESFFSNMDTTPQDILLKFGFQWPVSSHEIAIKAMINRCRAENQFMSWQDVTHDYFCEHQAISFLSPEAFVYYLPAMMKLYLQGQENMWYAYKFEFYIKRAYKEIIALLNHEQVGFIIDFLQLYCEDNNSPYERDEMILIIKKIKESLSG